MDDPAEVTVVIPAAGAANPALVALSSRLAAAMTPVDGKPVIYWTLSYLYERGFRRAVIAVRDASCGVAEFVERSFGGRLDVQFVVPDRDLGLAYTLTCCARIVTTRQALVVLGDTYFRFPPELDWGAARDFVLTSRVQESYRWCLVETSPLGRVTAFHDKPRHYSGPMHALIGCYGLSSWPRFVALLQHKLRAQNTGVELSMALSELIGAGIETYQCEEWYDCGNPDKLTESRRRLMQTRSFNRIDFDALRGVVTKRSDHTAKFIDEVQYFEQLPRELLIFFPRVVASDVRGAEPYMQMEYYGYPPLSEAFVFGSWSEHIWKQIFTQLRDTLELFARYPSPVDAASVQYMYGPRVLERVAQLARGDSALAELARRRESYQLDGVEQQSFEQLWPQVRPVLERMGRAADYCAIHGDLCFSNILFDATSWICKLIDPRGSFGAKGVYGDRKYDVAKLYQCVHGLYDFLISDLFEVSYRDGQAHLDCFAHEDCAEILSAFEEVFFTHFDRTEICALEGLLFLTMGVFHAEHPDRQLAMFLRGLQIWNELLPHLPRRR